MSRCFPFPPPGYEKKARTDDDLLTKEKHKEKKHKKEKKDKKREGKEKKDKDRSKDKQKKDRKDKHKDKKDKDRDKDKNKTLDDKSKNSGEKRIEGGIPESYNGGKTSENSQRPVEIKVSKSVEDLGRGIGDEDRRTRNQMVETFNGTNQWRAEGMGRVVEKDYEKRGEGDKKGDDKKADGQRKRDVEGCIGSTMVQNFPRVDQKRVGKDNNNDKKGDDRKASGQRNIDGEGSIENAALQNFTGFDQKRVEGMAGLMVKDAEKGKEKNKSKASDEKLGDKHKKREKKSKGKDKDRDKEKEKEKKKEKLKEKGDLKNNKLDKLTDSSKDRIDTLNIKPPQIPKDSNNGAATEGNFRKRKDLESNGFLHENETRPSKSLKPAFSSQPFTENGRKLEPCQTATQCASDRQGASNNLKVDNKEHKVNGIIEAQTSSVNSTKSSFASLHASENGGASSKPPHPDTKYLSQILSIPKMEEWSDFDDQEWLFNSDNLQPKKPKDGSSGVEEKPQVWAEAVRIESADVCALPAAELQTEPFEKVWQHQGVKMVSRFLLLHSLVILPVFFQVGAYLHDLD
ncbi:hypothetical protein BVC80_8843g11 [Macleaya cordata]|uniref:Uncharacterized protein n=1 Tax=Macleaya cordata TaxID=56857 RepID=A0A200PZY8_MACCD|nr:hypothetical protein BVC80_8843g11 [Macleaya cordata]